MAAVVGLIHAYLIWSSDILLLYAIMGLLLYPLRKLSPKALLIMAGILMVIVVGDEVGHYLRVRKLHHEYEMVEAYEKSGQKLRRDQEQTKRNSECAVTGFSPSAEDLKEETESHLDGYRKLLGFRVKAVYACHSNPI